MTGATLQTPNRGLNRAVSRCVDGRTTYSVPPRSRATEPPGELSQTRVRPLYELYNVLHDYRRITPVSTTKNEDNAVFYR